MTFFQQAKRFLQGLDKIVGLNGGSNAVEKLQRCDPEVINIVILGFRQLAEISGSPGEYVEIAQALVADGVAGDQVTAAIRFINELQSG